MQGKERKWQRNEWDVIRISSAGWRWSLKSCENILALSQELGVHRRQRESTLRKEVHQLMRLLADKTLEVGFFKGALQKVEVRRQRKESSGEKASTTKSGRYDRRPEEVDTRKARKKAESNNQGTGRMASGGIMCWDGGLYIVLSLALVAGGAFAQTSNEPSKADQRRTIRVGIAAMTNRSRRQVIPTWERDQLMRELQRLRADRKSSVVLEPVSLEATSRKDASAEADKKGCQYFVLTTLLDPSHGPAFRGVQTGFTRLLSSSETPIPTKPWQWISQFSKLALPER